MCRTSETKKKRKQKRFFCLIKSLKISIGQALKIDCFRFLGSFWRIVRSVFKTTRMNGRNLFLRFFFFFSESIRENETGGHRNERENERAAWFLSGAECKFISYGRDVMHNFMHDHYVSIDTGKYRRWRGRVWRGATDGTNPPRRFLMNKVINGLTVSLQQTTFA